MDVLTLTAISSSAVAVAKKLIETWSSEPSLRLGKKRARIELPVGLELSPQFVEALTEALAKANPPAGILTLSRKASGSETSAFSTPTEIGALALALSPESVFVDARNRIGLVFRLNLGIAITLAVILLAGIAGGVYSAVFLQNRVWSSVFGGVSIADLIGVYVFKPLAAINAALVSTIRLDNLQLGLQQQLANCTQLTDAQQRIECQSSVWEKIQIELATLSPVPSSRPLSKRRR